MPADADDGGAGPAGIDDEAPGIERGLTSSPLHITVDQVMDHLVGLASGHVIDGKPQSEYEFIADDVALLLDAPDGDVIGFIIDNLSALDATDIDAIWEEARFAAPLLGLSDASIGEIAIAALATYGEDSTLDARCFHTAVEQEGEEALETWRLCLEAGDQRAHFALGYTLCELERFHEAYAHLRHYSEITPHNAWVQCWLGHACVGLGETAEAIAAYRRAIELSRLGSYETDAPERLAELGAEPLPPKPTASRMIRREREDAHPRAALLFVWEGEDGERTLETWRELGAVAFDDPLETGEAPLATGIRLEHRGEEGETWGALVGPDGQPLLENELSIGPGPWLDAVRSEGELVLLLTDARLDPGEVPPGTVSPELRRRLEEIAAEGHLLALRAEAVEASAEENSFGFLPSDPEERETFLRELAEMGTHDPVGRRPKRDRAKRERDPEPKPEPEWDLEDLIIDAVCEGAAWVAVGGYPTEEAALRFIGRAFPEVDWRLDGREYLVPDEYEGPNNAWWVKSDAGVSGAIEFWRLLDADREEYYDCRRWRLNPYYEGERSDPSELKTYQQDEEGAY